MPHECDSSVATLPGHGALRIAVVSATGRGQTLLSSFDAALQQCGVHNYNLLPLSSVIPPGSEVVSANHRPSPPEEFGHRLYVVKAEAASAAPGSVVAAGIGWYQWGDGRGVFVEHAANAEFDSCGDVEAALSAEIRGSLRDLCGFRGVAFAEERVCQRVAVARVEQQPTTALVVAVYQAAGWQANPTVRA